MANILNIAQSGLTAAQVGLTTTGHNIANANTPGYNRQVVTQGTATSQNAGYGFIGKGTQVNSVERVYNEYLAGRILASQSAAGELTSYSSQIKQINNMLADSSVGISPSLQEFFKGVQTLAADPNSNAARQSMLSGGETLAAQFKTIDGQLRQMHEGINRQVTTSIETINSYAKQIGQLNDSIEKAQGGNEGRPANDLLDQRDQIISELSKEIKVTVVKQESTYNVFIGNGQPLVVGNKPMTLVPVASATDLSRMQVGFLNNGQTIPLSEAAIAGGKLGGVFAFRANTLDQAQNSLGRVAIGLATNFNAQHQLGQDRNGNIGRAFFNVGTPSVKPSNLNQGTAQIGAGIIDAGALTISDYQVKWDGDASRYNITRLSDGRVTSSTFPVTVDGVEFRAVSGTPQTGDTFLVRPTANGASEISVAISDKSNVAAAAPIRTVNGAIVNGAIVNSNVGSGKISPGVVTSTSELPLSAELTFAAPVAPATTGLLSGFPSAYPVTVTSNGASTTYAAGTAVPYTDGATISFAGISMELAGTPADGDKFTVSPNTNGSGDNRNALLLGQLQARNTLDNGSLTYQGAYAQLVNTIGNKTHELEVTSASEIKLMNQVQELQQADSGVNLDEEATNLLRYQQAYVAAGKVMQTASKLFDVLLTLGN